MYFSALSPKIVAVLPSHPNNRTILLIIPYYSNNPYYLKRKFLQTQGFMLNELLFP